VIPQWKLPGIDFLARLQCETDPDCPEPAKYEARFMCCNTPQLICSGHRAHRRRQSLRGTPLACPGCKAPTPEEHTTWRPL
jgi:hypothetical protein